ncbi:MAG: hypothetical protein M1826_007327 [Phylliscum demangeonii]|nr:MAG: hypothetical protein M1826_007327 [Phylliscum demangeonii]
MECELPAPPLSEPNSQQLQQTPQRRRPTSLTELLNPDIVEPLTRPDGPVTAGGHGNDGLDRPDRMSTTITGSVSLDDPDVRIAAQALGDLRADFIQSSPNPHSSSTAGAGVVVRQESIDPGPTGKPISQEPLLSLLTTTHPLLSTAINGSLSAYTSSKSYSSRFRYGAEFVERHIGSPVVSTVGSVGRRTGVEDGVRWWLGAHRSKDAPSGSTEEDQESEVAAKRRKVDDLSAGNMNIDVERGLGRRRLSNSAVTSVNPPAYNERRTSEASFAESLPAYHEDLRLPGYDAHQEQHQEQHQDSTQQPAWSSRLMRSTSGLGVAMSDESLRSLRYCLTWLRWANQHLGKVVVALKELVNRWDASHQPPASATSSPLHQIEDRLPPTSEPAPLSALEGTPNVDDRVGLVQHIQALKLDVLHTLKNVIDVVSRYAGGALPENARALVRYYLTSLPQRFHSASTLSLSPTSTSSSSIHATASESSSVTADGPGNALGNGHRTASETLASARRVILLAMEGLDMMTQVSGVLDGTIASAEEWCDRLGRRKSGSRAEKETETETLPRPQAPRGALPREASKHGRFDPTSAAIGAVAGAGVVGTVGGIWASRTINDKNAEVETRSENESHLLRVVREHSREKEQLKETLRNKEAEIRNLKGLPSTEEEKQQAQFKQKEEFVAKFLPMLEGEAHGGEGKGVLPPGAWHVVQEAADPAMKTCVYHSYLMRAPELLLERLDSIAYWNEVVSRCIDQLGCDRDTTLARWSLPASTTTTGQTATEPNSQPRRAVDENHGNPHSLNFVVHRVGKNIQRLVHGVQAWQRAAWPAHAPGIGTERPTAKVKNAEWGLVKAFE